MRNLQTTSKALKSPTLDVLKRPDYFPSESNKGVAFAVGSMRDHMTNEGWQIMQALESQNFTLCGNKLTVNETDTKKILEETNPSIVVIQDKREWDLERDDFRDKTDTFRNITELKNRSDIFKLTILKDAHQRPDYHRQSADEVGCHAWIVYYHPVIVKRVASYVREEDLIRTYHSLDSSLIPEFKDRRKCTLLSGAVSDVYPLRRRLIDHYRLLPECTYLKHPGYHRNGTATNDYLKTLSEYRIAICTSSVYGYALRKIIEASACGCKVITDLPVDEKLPFVEDNLIRVPVNIALNKLSNIIRHAYKKYDYEKQKLIAENTSNFYDYRNQGKLLVKKILKHRDSYCA
jgi:hypothetical protein